MDEHTLNDLLECSVCLERLDTSSKVLPCQHTFCRKCLEVILSSRQELRCPECRILVDVKIDDLPPNVLLMRILEGMKNAAAKTQQQQKQSESFKTSNDYKRLEEQQQHPTKLAQQQQQQQKQMLHYQQQQQYKQKQHQQQQQIALHQQQQQQSQRRCLLPHAYALYDFDSNESSDLNFKKGDLILLKRKIDINWFVGQLNGNEGTFPINYVQVMVPLPTAQCIALYDFKMGPNEEEGCLNFKKGTVIHVLRRVDHNWAEGRIGATIGIFPIAFVELNTLAKQLLDSYVLLNSTTATPVATVAANAAASAAAALAPTVAMPPNATATSSVQQHNSQMPAPRNLPPIPLIDPTTNLHPSDSTTSSSSNSPSNTTSPNSTTTTCSSNSSSNSITSTPNQSLPNTPQHAAAKNANNSSNNASIRFRDCKEKRHSLNALLLHSAATNQNASTSAALSALQTNRHSAEILSIPNEMNAIVAGTYAASGNQSTSAQNLRMRCSNDAGNIATTNATQISTATPQTTPAREQQQYQQNATSSNSSGNSSGSGNTSHSRVNVLKTNVQQNVMPTLPWGHLALYPYKPRKNDELELKKGCVYIVTERCLDGWFKGKNWQDISGVFPGNYVTPLRQRDQQQLMHQWKYVPLQANLNNSTTNATGSCTGKNQNQTHFEHLNARLTSTCSSSGSSNNGAAVVNLPHQPPDLPPRQLGITNNSNVAGTTTTTTCSSSVWSKPLGQTMEALFNRTNNKAQSEINLIKDIKEKETKQKDMTTTAATTSSSTSAAVNLMKRLAHMKSRSKSPSSSTINADVTNIAATAGATMTAMPAEHNLILAEATNNKNTPTQMHPVHVRSGSCPSQLLQSLPIELTQAQMNDNILSQQQQQQQAQLPPATYGSQRIKGSKERPQLQNIRQSMDGTYRGSSIITTPPTSQQQQQVNACNMLLTKCSQQQQQQQQINNIIQHRKSQSLDANTLTAPLIATAAATTTTTAPATAALTCNITTAAIVASATTKSTQNTRESRFRCVVPYPPNSDIELELHIGDIIYVHRKQKNGWYKGTHARTNKTGLFPASFVEPDI